MSSLPQLSLAERLRDAVVRLQNMRDTHAVAAFDVLLDEVEPLRRTVIAEIAVARRTAWEQSGIGWVTLRWISQTCRVRLLRTTKTLAIVSRSVDASEERYQIDRPDKHNLGARVGVHGYSASYETWTLDLDSFHAAIAEKTCKE